MKRLVNCAVQKYAWGKLGEQSTVAQLAQSSQQQTTVINNDDHYAEFWMGTHASGPSSIISSNDNGKQEQVLSLKDYLGGDLPFLFKVLSIRQALSIQAHPDAELAALLHQRDPSSYRDGNHKPELCCALTDFEALCGFRPLREVASFVKNVPELRDLFDQNILTEFETDLDDAVQSHNSSVRKQKLRLIFSAFIRATSDHVKQQLHKLIDRLRQETTVSLESDLLLRLAETYPGDIGCFAVYFLRILNLKPGEALFLAPNEPHAYIFGDCIEIMANSDNVVRAGLTPKFRDVETLSDMLTYSDDSLERYMNYGRGQMLNNEIALYAPPVPEFKLFRVQFNSGSTRLTLSEISVLLVIQSTDGASITIAGHDNSVQLQKGDVYLIPAQTELQIENQSTDELLLFVGSSNSSK